MSWINLSALWKILVFGLIAGAGLPALFATGLYALSLGPHRAQAATAGADGGDDSDVLVGGSIAGMVIAALCGLIYWQSRRTKVDHNNVNAEWTGASHGGITPATVTETAAA